MTLEEYRGRKNEEEKPSFLNNYLIKSLISAIVVFLVLIVVNFFPKSKSIINDNVFKTNFNFAKINNLYNKYVTGLFNKKEEVPVYNEKVENKYEYYKDGVKVTNENEEVTLLNSGIVIFIGEKEGYGNTIIIQQSNGTDAWYAGLSKIDAKLYDYIEKGKIIGSKNSSYYLLFQKEGKFLDYKDVIK